MSSWDNDYREDIARALVTPGGHLSIGRGGCTLFYNDSRLSGCRDDLIKAQAIAAGLPVIDSRDAPFALVARVAVRGPMVAVNRPASPQPWNALSYVPLAIYAEIYRRIGAEVINLPSDPERPIAVMKVPNEGVRELYDIWLNQLLSCEGLLA